MVELCNPATQQDVFDVSGAGDTVVAMIDSCLASGLSMRLALHIANGAAGIVVSEVEHIQSIARVD